MVNDIDTNDYNNILNNTYIVLKKDIENIMPNINRTLKVRNNPNDEYVYVFRLEVDGILDIVSPLTQRYCRLRQNFYTVRKGLQTKTLESNKN